MTVTDAPTDRRDWSWDTDGTLEGLYVETRNVTVRNGPSAGRAKLLFDFHLAADDSSVSVWETTVLRSKFREELKRRGKPEFEAGERIVITPTGTKEGVNGVYRDFDVAFEFAAPKPTTAELLGMSDERESGEESADGDDGTIPF